MRNQRGAGRTHRSSARDDTDTTCLLFRQPPNNPFLCQNCTIPSFFHSENNIFWAIIITHQTSIFSIFQLRPMAFRDLMPSLGFCPFHALLWLLQAFMLFRFIKFLEIFLQSVWGHFFVRPLDLEPYKQSWTGQYYEMMSDMDLFPRFLIDQ